jgi:hypothetical protein
MPQLPFSLSALRSIRLPRRSSWGLTLIVPAILFAPALRGIAQALTPATPPAGSNWQHVQALPQGTNIHIKAQHASASCALKSADADSLTCLHGKEITFQRTEIKSITISRRVLSTAIGAAAGAGVGTAIGAGLGPSFWANRGKGAAVGIAIFTPIGAIIGAGTNFAQSTVYRAP